MLSRRNESKAKETALELLRRRITKCEKCPRLVEFRNSVKPRASYAGQTYWKRPVPGFGDINGRLLILGLAPAAHGGNRTGRIFTGDSSGRFLVRALYAAGFASELVSESIDDGLVYNDCYLTAVVKCVPPGDRPIPSEFANCSGYLAEEIGLMDNLKVVLALGTLSFKAYVDFLKVNGTNISGLKFKHGGVWRIEGSPLLFSSYHPSPRNTNTGRLTLPMLVKVIKNVRADLRSRVGSQKHN